MTESTEKYKVTQNACKLCTPLGACLAFRGVEGCIPFLHGSQGCATYIRRYMISHFKEPMDIASSSFSETTAIFGGKNNLLTGIRNVVQQYKPEAIGIATTCLSETIGDDVGLFLNELKKEINYDNLPTLIPVSTPSYQGTHAEGYLSAVRSIVAELAENGPAHKALNIIPNMVSPADIRYLKEILEDFNIPYILLPDYSETMDGPNWHEYHKIPRGGTPLAKIRKMGHATATIEFTATGDFSKTAGNLLSEKFGVANYTTGYPIGVVQTDFFMNLLSEIFQTPIPEKHRLERGRLLDAYVDAHKYLFDKKAILYGEQDLVVGMAAFLAETGIIPVLCASGAKTGRMKKKIEIMAPKIANQITVLEGVDFHDIEDLARELKPDLLIGNSKAYKISRNLKIPLVRIGFPIHDRFGGARLLHLGYRGTQQMFDKIVNAVIETNQDSSPVGYSYM